MQRGNIKELQRSVEGVEALGLDRADLNDARVVDKHIDAAEAGNRLVHDAAALGCVEQVGGDEVEVLGSHVLVFGEDLSLSALQFGAVAGDQDQAHRLAGKTFRHGKPQPARASGYQHDGVVSYRDERPQCPEDQPAHDNGCNRSGNGSASGHSSAGEQVLFTQDSHAELGCALSLARGILLAGTRKRRSRWRQKERTRART